MSAPAYRSLRLAANVQADAIAVLTHLPYNNEPTRQQYLTPDDVQFIDAMRMHTAQRLPISRGSVEKLRALEEKVVAGEVAALLSAHRRKWARRIAIAVSGLGGALIVRWLS